MRVAVRVPASSANLGPGYDAFGLALALHARFEAEAADAWTIIVRGEGAEVLSTTSDNAVVRAMHAVATSLDRVLAPCSLMCDNGIPLGRGLGSSAAAVVGGVLLADAFLEAKLPRSRVLELASAVEGHPDNVAAAIFGGFTVSYPGEEGPSCARIEPAAGLAVVVALGDQPLSTGLAREAIPRTVPHDRAAANAAHAALTALGIGLGDAALTRVGLVDRIHEPYRASLVPDLEEVRSALLAAGTDGAVLSGAGPTVVGLVHAENDEAALARAEEIAAVVSTGLVARDRVVALAVDREGAVVEVRP
jgi:homoserine kinase